VLVRSGCVGVKVGVAVGEIVAGEVPVGGDGVLVKIGMVPSSQEPKIKDRMKRLMTRKILVFICTYQMIDVSEPGFVPLITCYRPVREVVSQNPNSVLEMHIYTQG
jgi:hypothetical protein